MELFVAQFPFLRQLSSCFGGHSAMGAGKAMVGQDQLFFPFLITALDRFAQGQRFQPDTGFDQLF